MDQRHAKLRVCASCEWIFRNSTSCPKCGFAHYGARHVYGNKCYNFEKTQVPWINRKVDNYICELQEQVNKREV
jgi:hypothetical protein